MQNHSLNILALDDDPFILKVLTRMLADLGYSAVTTCDNGAAALRRVADPATTPDLILLDLNMPDMDGIEFVHHLVGQQFAGSLILVSGEAVRVLQSVEKLVKAHRMTVLGHLHKPVLPAELAAAMAHGQQPSDMPPAKKCYSAKDLATALRSKELINYYQPKVSVKTGAVIGVEALVRWLHPVDGLIGPDQFIGVAEKSALIDDLTRSVLTAALAQNSSWQQAGLNLRVAVNLSMHNLASTAFANFISAATLTAGVAPQSMVLEVTESRLPHDQRAPLEILTRLRLKRFRLSIDDFGTGHSSLSQLRDIPFDELKIDQGFVHGAGHDQTLRAIFDASLGLGHQLGMEVVAEGVEDADDWAWVRSTACDLAQGYFIARPMPAADLPGWIDDWLQRYPGISP